ncbi:hypothetical protein, partial [Cronobacter sakazakii]|uniref:hypothetical protein n=1 Tax=Cronobacter sakazakii TaxID=28141 RepID=UPI001F451DCE
AMGDPPLGDMLKLSGCSCLISGAEIEEIFVLCMLLSDTYALVPDEITYESDHFVGSRSISCIPT